MLKRQIAYPIEGVRIKAWTLAHISGIGLVREDCSDSNVPAPTGCGDGVILSAAAEAYLGLGVSGRVSPMPTS